MFDVLECSVIATEAKVAAIISVGLGALFLAFYKNICEWWDGILTKMQPPRNPDAVPTRGPDAKRKKEVDRRKKEAAEQLNSYQKVNRPRRKNKNWYDDDDDDYDDGDDDNPWLNVPTAEGF